MASLLARRGCVAVVGGCGLVAGQRFAFAEEGDGEGGGAAGTAPKAPGIYKDGGFDPSPIENVAKLLKETNGKLSALQHRKREELEKQDEERKRQKEYKQALRAMGQEVRQVQRQEEEATRSEQRKHAEERSRFKAALAAETQQLAGRLEEALKDGEEGRRAAHEARLEAIRKDTAELEQELRRETDAAYLKAKYSAEAKAEREMQDLRLDSIKERAKVARDTTVEAVTATFSSLGAGLTALLADEKRLAALAAVATAAAGGVFVARKFTSVLGTYVEARLRKPALVRETSRGYAVASSALGTGGAGRVVSRLSALGGGGGVDGARLMAGATFEPALEARLRRVAETASNTKKHGAVFRHCLFHGPPGTGKTLFAKKLAAHAGMDYAIASGGDVAPLGRDAVTEMHKLFDWAKTSPRGLLLLIDEADAFVRRRSPNMSEDSRNALNAFLYRTGTPNSDVMVVFATNAPELFDKAIHDRVDEVVLFDLPGEAERLKILSGLLEDMVDPDKRPPRSLFRTLFAPPPKVVSLDPAIDDAAVARAAERTDDFSAREVAKLALAWQANALASEDAVLTKDLFEKTIDTQIDQTKLKRDWKARELAKAKAALAK